MLTCYGNLNETRLSYVMFYYRTIWISDSYYRNVLSSNVLSLQEKGVLTQLKKKWWKEKRGGGACQVKEPKKI